MLSTEKIADRLIPTTLMVRLRPAFDGVLTGRGEKAVAGRIALFAFAGRRLSHDHHAGEPHHFESFLRETIRWTFWPSLAMAFLILVGRFGPEFDAGYPLLLILMIGVLACAAVYFTTILLNIALNVMRIPLCGFYGAAFATALAMICGAATLSLVACCRLGLKMFILAGPTLQPSRPLEEIG